MTARYHTRNETSFDRRNVIIRVSLIRVTSRRPGGYFINHRRSCVLCNEREKEKRKREREREREKGEKVIGEMMRSSGNKVTCQMVAALFYDLGAETKLISHIVATVQTPTINFSFYSFSM